MFKKTYKLYNYIGNRPNINDDFYGWSNHNWFLNNYIPDDKTKYTHFTQTQDDIDLKLKKLLESNIFPLGHKLYTSYLNFDYRDNNALKELLEIKKLIIFLKNHYLL